MNNQLLIVETGFLFVIVIGLFIVKEWEGNEKIIKLLFSLSNIINRRFKLQDLYNRQLDILIAISMFLMIVYIYKEYKKEKNDIPQIQILNTQLSERNNKVDQEIELPQQLAVIHSIHESNSSMNRNQNASAADNNRRQSNSQGEITDQQQTKQDYGTNFLDDHKRPSLQQKNNNGLGMFITRQQSVAQIQPNLNVIKFQDDLGEIKFGILKTLKSVAYDQLGKEVECIFQTDRPFTKLLSTVEQTNQPRMQILYESQVVNNQYVDDTLRGAIQLDNLGYGEKKTQKNITWQKIIKAFILIIILKLNFVIINNWNLYQLILILFILQRQLLQFKKLITKSLDMKCEVRETLIWISLVVLPIVIIILINLIDKRIVKHIMKVANWISLIITSKYNKNCSEQNYQKYYQLDISMVLYCSFLHLQQYSVLFECDIYIYYSYQQFFFFQQFVIILIYQQIY
ncbi:unnamed protein product [Paramecium sonneborni]|uniref:Transmembrane protein n=1 Tax=Paramecium sonneborni TaxID=65129 RepID=A0A8S1JSA0_9CILI|nr:unnamed protein product [Paramecium sonneborni]